MFEAIKEPATRPTSVTVISWLLIVIGLASCYSFLRYWNDPLAQELMAKSLLPVNVQLALSVIGVAVLIASGAAMLSGRNWGRLTYVTWSVVSIVVSLVTSPMKILVLPSILITALFAVLLFRPAATAYFSASQRSAA